MEEEDVSIVEIVPPKKVIAFVDLTTEKEHTTFNSQRNKMITPCRGVMQPQFKDPRKNNRMRMRMNWPRPPLPSSSFHFMLVEKTWDGYHYVLNSEPVSEKVRFQVLREAIVRNMKKDEKLREKVEELLKERTNKKN